MSTVQRTSGYNYQDYVPVEGITCPICDVACTSLQTLNLHLDEAHTEEDSKGALLSWFRNAQKKVQTTLASNARSPPGSSSGGGSSVERSLKQFVDPVFMSSFQNLSLNGGGPAYFASDSEGDFVSRSHWQPDSANDICSFPGCGKALGRIGAARQHCRQCGKIFCEAHTQYEIKLDRHARHDPVNGVWCRVCFGCFVSRPDYISVSGVTRSWTDTFLKKRAKTIDRVHLESNRLERRLEKLARIHHSTDIGSPCDTLRSGSSSSLSALSLLEKTDSTSSRDSGSVMSSRSAARVSNGNSILSMKLKYRDGEQTVTKWQDDKNVTNCPLCSSKFTLTNRKHHCRLCGRVICGQSRCSRMIPLFLDMSSNHFDEEPVGDTRACTDCQRSVFRRKTMHEEASRPLPIIQLYHQLSITRQNIEKQLPLFHDMIVLLEKDKLSRQSQVNLQKAAQVRKSLLDSFALYDTLAKTIKSLPVRSPSVRRLQGNICTAANLYLQQNMLPLQMLPRILKPEKQKQQKQLNGSSSPKPQREELALQLETFQEQEALLQSYIRDAQRNRKYDDVKTLQRSLEEVRAEIDRIKCNLA